MNELTHDKARNSHWGSIISCLGTFLLFSFKNLKNFFESWSNSLVFYIYHINFVVPIHLSNREKGVSFLSLPEIFNTLKTSSRLPPSLGAGVFASVHSFFFFRNLFSATCWLKLLRQITARSNKQTEKWGYWASKKLSIIFVLS